MDSSKITAACKFGLVAAACATAASIWAAGATEEEAYLLDATMWEQEVQAGGNWPGDGWYRLVPHERAIEVRPVRPGSENLVPTDALYLRLPGTTLKQGDRPSYRHPATLAQPRLGQDHELTLGKTRFSLRVENEAKGMQYVIGYGGQTYTYVLGPFDATRTSVRAVADLDGDTRPDFLVDVDDATYLLLSTRAVPGLNRPAAELWARHEGC